MSGTKRRPRPPVNLICEGACNPTNSNHVYTWHRFSGVFDVTGIFEQTEGFLFYACMTCGARRRFGAGKKAISDWDSGGTSFEIRKPDPPKPRGWLRDVTLRDDECWQRTGTWYGSIEPAQYRRMKTGETWTAPSRCTNCGSVKLAWNGMTYWCDDCDSPNFYEVKAVYWRSRVGRGNLTLAVQPCDPWYEQETQYVRVPATLNWPHGRFRPDVDRWHERTKRKKRTIDPKEL